MGFYTNHIFCCTNTREPGHRRGSCGQGGAEELRSYMKSKAKEMGLESTRVNNAGCLDRCELGPCIVVYPQGKWFRCGTKEEADTILRSLRDGSDAKHLELPS